MIVSSIFDKLNNQKEKMLIAEMSALERNVNTKKNRTISKYLKSIKFEFVHNSLALTGFQVGENDAFEFLAKGNLSSQYTLNEYLILKNYYEIVDYLFESDLRNINITEETMQELHSQLTKGVSEIKDRKNGNTIYIRHGVYRDEDSREAVSEVIEWTRTRQNDPNPIEQLIMFYVKFVLAKPFEFGSALISFLMINIILIKNEFVPIIINKNLFEDYHQAIVEAKYGKYSTIKDFIIDRISENLTRATDYLTGYEITDNNELKSRIDEFYNKIKSYNESQTKDKQNKNIENTDNLSIEDNIKSFHSLLDKMFKELFVSGEFKELEWEVKSPVRTDNFPIANSVIIVENFDDMENKITNTLVGPTYLDRLEEGSGIYVKLIPHEQYIPEAILAMCFLHNMDKLYIVSSISIAHLEGGKNKLVPNEKSKILCKEGAVDFNNWSLEEIEVFFANSVDTFLNLVEKETEERKSSFDFEK